MRADHSRPGLFVRRQLDRLRVKCKAADCTWTGRLGDGHDLQCEKQITTCVHQHVGSGDPCGWRGPIPSLGEHDLVCPFKPVVCPREGCTAALSRKDLDIHESTCTYFRCVAPLDKLGSKLTRLGDQMLLLRTGWLPFSRASRRARDPSDLLHTPTRAAGTTRGDLFGGEAVAVARRGARGPAAGSGGEHGATASLGGTRRRLPLAGNHRR